MATPARPERNRAARSFRQLSRFFAQSPDRVFGTHRSAVLPVTTLCGRSTHIAEPDIALDKLPRPQSGFAEAAAAGSFEPNDIPTFQHHVRDLGGQRLRLTVADQIECTWRRGPSAGETKGTELEAIEIGRKRRHRTVDPPFAPETQAAAPPAGTA